MSALIIENRTRFTQYFHRQVQSLRSRQEVLDSFDWDRSLKSLALDAHLQNGIPPVTRPDCYFPVIDLVPIPPRTRWLWDRQHFAFHSAFGRGRYQFPDFPGISDLDSVAKRYVNAFQSQTYGIELSGGLDSAIVIDLVTRNGGNPILIGYASNRYEFRTERAVQEAYKGYPQSVVLIPEEEGKPFAHLKATPAHVLPAVPALFHHLQARIADAARSAGATCVLNGVGGDTLLAERLGADPSSQTVRSYSGWELYDPWPNDNVYAPRGMAYVPSFSLAPFPQLLCAMRRGEPEDSRKLWARKLLRGRLPVQLTEWAYKADHAGWVSSGLREAEAEIHEIITIANRALGASVINRDEIIAFVRNAPHLNDAQQRRLLSLMSLSVWIFTLVRDKRIHD